MQVKGILGRMTFKPLSLALWVLVTGVSFGLGLGSPVVFWAGVLGPIVILAAALVLT